MRHQIFRPPPALSEYVKYFWCLDVKDTFKENYQINTLVDDSCGLVFHHQEGSGAIVTDNKLQPVSMLYGQTTRPSFNRAISGFKAVGALFKPHAIHSIFGEHGSFFTDAVIPFYEYEDPELTWSILETDNVNDQINLITKYLFNKIDSVSQSERLVENCLSLINSKQGSLTVGDLYSHFKISERKLERLFNRVIGVTPRHYLKVMRFNNALDIMRMMPNEKLTSIAYEAGYSDQAHFNRVVREFTGFTPTQLKEFQNLPVNLISQ